MSKFNTYQETGGIALVEPNEVGSVCEAKGEISAEDFIDLITLKVSLVGGLSTRFSQEVRLAGEIF